MELEGTIKAISFKPNGKSKDVVATVTLECKPNELQAGRLSRLAGKQVTVNIFSRQLGLPLREEEQPAHVVAGVD